MQGKACSTSESADTSVVAIMLLAICLTLQQECKVQHLVQQKKLIFSVGSIMLPAICLISVQECKVKLDTSVVAIICSPPYASFPYRSAR
jgi:translation initiation factor 2 gamma subunit (eIF-2gamma)